MEIMLVRHTEVGVSSNTVYGRTDVPLAATFDEEKLDVAKRIKHFWPEGPTRIVASPATRTQRLADHLSQQTPELAIYTDDRLIEVGFGAWEMQTWNDIPRSESEAWMNDYVNIRPPHGELLGESLSDLSHRVTAAFTEIIDVGADRTLVVVHGAVIRAALCHFLGLPLRQAFSLEIDKGSVSRVTFRGSGEARRPLVLGINYR